MKLVSLPPGVSLPDLGPLKKTSLVLHYEIQDSRTPGSSLRFAAGTDGVSMPARIMAAVLLYGRESISDGAKLEGALLDLQESLGSFFRMLWTSQISSTSIDESLEATRLLIKLLNAHSELEDDIPHKTVLGIQDVITALSALSRAFIESSSRLVPKERTASLRTAKDHLVALLEELDYMQGLISRLA